MAETSLNITTGNEITTTGKVIAGTLFIVFTLVATITLIGYWPDKLPKDEVALYQNKIFHVQLLDSTNLRTNISLQKVAASNQHVITLNILLLMLVAIAGFLGTMIHTASSFTNYVGSEKFKKSWILWYCVKPFTGAGLALILYFVFRAGLLNFNDTSNLNIYGIITLSGLAGLFTDRVTLKLEEVFAVIFKPKDDRPDKIDQTEVNVKISGIMPETLLANMDNNLTISGESLDKKKFIIKIDEDEIKNPVITADSISFAYKIPDTAGNKESFLLRIVDGHGNEIYTSKLLRGASGNNALTADNEKLN